MMTETDMPTGSFLNHEVVCCHPVRDHWSDASNRDSNKGILNARYEPYTPLLEAMRELNTRIHPLIRQLDSAK